MLILLLSKPLVSLPIVNLRTWIPEMIGKLVKANNSINTMICRCLVKTWYILTKKTLLHFDHIGSNMSNKIKKEELDNVGMVSNKQLQYYMYLQKPVPLVLNILCNVNSLHLKLSRTSVCLVEMLKMLLFILWRLKPLHL